MKYILGKKLEMTQIWKGDEMVAVTKVQAGPCTVVQVRNSEKDGYKAVQVGFDKKKEKNISKPQLGHLKDLEKHRYMREFRLGDKENAGVSRGDIIDVTTFAEGDRVKVTGTSKGKGFQGVVKRHGFHGQNSTHGHKDQERMSGSIGAGGNQHVLKGTRMGGRTGGDRVTVSNLTIMAVDAETGMLYIKGAVPGHRNGLVMVYGDGELKVAPKAAAKAEEAAEEPKAAAEETATEAAEEAAENQA
jgi:large subunit ribosomal protein L3